MPNMNILFQNKGSELMTAYFEITKDDNPNVHSDLFTPSSTNIIIGIPLH